MRKDGPAETCEICGRTFGSNRMLRNHINTVHNKVRPYMCSECGHTAANRSSLKMHLRQHTGTVNVSLFSNCCVFNVFSFLEMSLF